MLTALALVFPALGGSDPHLVAKIPDGCAAVEGRLRFSRDGAKCVCVVTQEGKEHPVVGSLLGGAFDEVDWPCIDPSGAHTAFRVLERNPKKKLAAYSILYDDKRITGEGWVGPLALDPGKGAVACWVGKGYTDVDDGHVEPSAVNLVWGKYKSNKFQFADRKSPPQFTFDGGILATTAGRGNGSWNVITVDEKGKEGKHGDGSLFESAIRPTGHAVAFTFANLVGERYWANEHQHFLIETASLDEHGDKSLIALFGEDYDAAGSPMFSADGLHLAYKATKGSGMGAVLDNQKNATCDFAFVDEIAIRPDGSEVAFTACNGCKLDEKNGREVLYGVQAKGGKWFVVHGSVRLGEYQLARSPTWSPDGKSLAYAAKIEGKWYAFAGSKRSEPCDDIACFAWSDDGRVLWYGCRDGAELWWRKLEGG